MGSILLFWVVYALARLGIWLIKDRRADKKADALLKKIIHNPSSPFYSWDLDELGPGELVPWKEVIHCKIFSKKYLKKPEYLFQEVTVSHYVVTNNTNHHYCINEDLICVYYSGNIYDDRLHTDVKGEGVLTICPTCKKQKYFNGSLLN